MERLPAFELKRPTSLAQAIEWLAATPEARAIAGGTDLVPNQRDGIGSPPVLVDLSRVVPNSDAGCRSREMLGRVPDFRIPD